MNVSKKKKKKKKKTRATLTAFKAMTTSSPQMFCAIWNLKKVRKKGKKERKTRKILTPMLQNKANPVK
jgi:hypothetical protein